MDGFQELRAESDPNGSWHMIQARKTGIGRSVTAGRKALQIDIRGNPNDFDVVLGEGEWGKNVFSAAMLGIGVAGILMNRSFEAKLWNFIQNSVNALAGSAARPPNEMTGSRPEYNASTQTSSYSPSPSAAAPQSLPPASSSASPVQGQEFKSVEQMPSPRQQEGIPPPPQSTADRISATGFKVLHELREENSDPG